MHITLATWSAHSPDVPSPGLDAALATGLANFHSPGSLAWRVQVLGGYEIQVPGAVLLGFAFLLVVLAFSKGARAVAAIVLAVLAKLLMLALDLTRKLIAPFAWGLVKQVAYAHLTVVWHLVTPRRRMFPTLEARTVASSRPTRGKPTSDASSKKP